MLQSNRVVAGLVCLMLLPFPAAADMSRTEKEELQALQREVQILKQQVRDLTIKLQASQGGSAPRAPFVIEQGNVSLDDDPRMGDKQAKVALVEFSDYQCPYCRRFHDQTFVHIKKNYIDKGKLLYVYRDFPLSSHKHAVPAAIAANCAGEQGKYFQMQKQLFDNGSRLNDRLYPSLARKLGLDMDRFEACLLNTGQTKEIEKDFMDGQRLGVRGTPGFFIGIIRGNELINVKPIRGAVPYTAFRQAIEAVLK